ncbi:MAG: PhoH family protein [Bacteroidales bacterium]
MSEQVISLSPYAPVDIFGVNDVNLEEIRAFFPKLKIISRGDMIKLIGEEKEIRSFEEKFHLILMHFDRFGKVSHSDLQLILGSSGEDYTPVFTGGDDILVHGRDGALIKAKTPNQQRMVESLKTNDLVIAVGPAGTGKTYTAVALAVRALKNKEVKRIILTRPAVEAGENLGFLPGDLRDKLDPYLQPLYDALRDMLPHQKLLNFFEDGTIEIAPLAFMRGRTLDNAFVILDEAQNATQSQLKMFLTRMGKTAKFVVTGDITQIDLPRNQSSGLVQAMNILHDIPGIEIILLDESDVIRHKLVTRIINAYNKIKE